MTKPATTARTYRRHGDLVPFLVMDDDAMHGVFHASIPGNALRAAHAQLMERGYFDEDYADAGALQVIDLRDLTDEDADAVFDEFGVRA